MAFKVAIVKNWRKYNLPHVMAGFIEENDFGAFVAPTLTFGDGSGIDITDKTDLIITSIKADEIPE